MDDLRGRIALVTGASRGIGRSIALALSEEGAKLIVNYQNRSAEAEQVISDIRKAGGEALSVQADVSEPNDVTGLVEQATAAFGRIDILVNNAGIAQLKPFDELTVADWD